MDRHPQRRRRQAGADARSIEAAMAGLEESIRLFTADFTRRRDAERRSWKRLAAAGLILGGAVLFALGVVAEQQFQIVAIHDPTGGWRDHVWERYGRRIVDCIVEAQRRQGETACTIAVRRP